MEGDKKIAIGLDSVLVDAEKAFDGISPNLGTSDLKFEWQTAGASTSDLDLKNVLSVGNKNKERIIKHVAAGKVDVGSTDAVNGGQLYSVIDVFGKLGFDVLGAVKNDDQTGFKTPTFTSLYDKNGHNFQIPAPKTFKEAIDKNIEKLNEGLNKGDMGDAQDKKTLL